MASLTRITDQVTALLNASTRGADGTPVYSSVVGDKARSANEISASCYNAAMQVARAVCETDSHPFRSEFIESVALDHSEPVPFHYGDISIPEIIPYSGAGFTMKGVKCPYDRIESYRRNRSNIYSPVAHNASDNGQASPIAGFYDNVNGIFYFTGYQASMLVALFDRTDVFDKLSDALEPVVIKVALGLSAKEGDTSDGLFQAWAVQGSNDLNEIRGGATAFQPVDMAVEARA
jgi:hypothetical protein